MNTCVKKFCTINVYKLNILYILIKKQLQLIHSLICMIISHLSITDLNGEGVYE